MRLLIGIFLIFISSNVFANCEISGLTTLDELNRAQSCMIDLLEKVDQVIKNQEDYNDRVKSTFETLISQEGDCKKWELLSNQNPNLNYLQSNIDECNKYYEDRLAQYTYVIEEYNKAKENFEGIDIERQALELKIEMLKKTHDLILNNNRR